MGMEATESQFHVLAVDDSVIDRKLIERLLKTSACQVTTVDSGSKALEFLGLQEHDKNHTNQPCVSLDNHQEAQINLIITDYCMSGMTGYDLLKKIKESASLRNIPVVIMSSENVPSRINRCLEEGAEEFFLKPVRLSDVDKLRPHMMKTKCKSHKQEESEIIVIEEKQASIEIAHVVPSQPPKETDTVQQQQQKSQVNSNNKRKDMEKIYHQTEQDQDTVALLLLSDLMMHIVLLLLYLHNFVTLISFLGYILFWFCYNVF